MFLENNESNLHLKSKYLLFDLLKERKCKMVDINLKEYPVYDGSHDNEFLQVESFVLTNGKNGYVNELLYSNKNFPCIRFNIQDPICEYIVEYGAIEEVPCKSCLIENFTNENTLFEVGYSPDISFGYDDQYKIWLEIKKSHPCTKEKIKFCYQNNIILLEVDASNIGYSGGIIMCNNLTDIKNYENEIKQKLPYIFGEISKKNFSTPYILYDISPVINWDNVQSILEPYNLIFLNKYNPNIGQYINSTKLKKMTSIVITKDLYNELNDIFDNNIYNNNEILELTKNQILDIIRTDINSLGYCRFADCKEIAIKFTVLNYNEIKDLINQLCEVNNWTMTKDYDRKKYSLKNRPILILPN